MGNKYEYVDDNDDWVVAESQDDDDYKKSDSESQEFISACRSGDFEFYVQHNDVDNLNWAGRVCLFRKKKGKFCKSCGHEL